MGKPEAKLTVARFLKRALIFAFIGSILPLNAAQAFDMCSIFKIIPRAVSDFDRLVGEVETVTGCRAQPVETVHERRWVCEDDLTTVQSDEAVTIVLLREPSVSAHLVIFFDGQTDLDFLRECSGSILTRGIRFQPGNIGLRDQGRLGEYGSTKLTLTSVNAKWGSVIVSDNAHYPLAGPFEISTWEWAHGYTALGYLNPALTTPVRIAGADPVSQPVKDVVAALTNRGAVLKNYTADSSNLRRKWELSAPNGLPGVNTISVDAVLEHTIFVKYGFSSVSDYERYIGVLDEQYGVSIRMRAGRCSNRIWLAGGITISGEYCPESTTLTFFNVATAEAFAASVTAALNVDQRPVKPQEKIIDRDNF